MFVNLTLLYKMSNDFTDKTKRLIKKSCGYLLKKFIIEKIYSDFNAIF